MSALLESFEEMTEEEIRQREEEIIGTGTEDELHDLRCWLFRESVRLDGVERSINDKVERFETERRQFREEMRDLNKQLERDRRRLREESDLFDKRLGVLKNGFDQLAADKKQLEQERMMLEAEREVVERARLGSGEFLFRGVCDSWTLRKRYRDLIKIFHPDNAGGDHEIIQMINHEYEELTSEYGA
ncbi:MAG: J domain-containing protein [Lachnospiraceae bacterium]|nr:J domain-containing protein [Lachnospiraceae bacterium]